MQYKYYDKTFQYKSNQAFNHFGYNAKSTQTICLKMPTALKHKFISCGGIMLIRMLHIEMWGTRGLEGGTGAAYSNQLGHNNLVDSSMSDVHIPTFEPA